MAKALGILKQSVLAARVGVAFKLKLFFMEPTQARADWLQANPPNAVVMLPKATNGGKPNFWAEAWFVWCRRREVDVVAAGEEG